MADLDWAKQHILVIDSDVTYLEWVSHLFEYVGIGEVKAAKDGDKALEILQGGFDADAIILELELRPINLKGMNAVTFIRRARDAELVPHNDIPIVISSPDAKKNPGLLRSVCLGGIESFITKPATIDQFLKRVSKTIQCPQRFVTHRAYFGPDRRQFPPVDFEGTERRRNRPSMTLLKRYLRALEKTTLPGSEITRLSEQATTAINKAIEQEKKAEQAERGGKENTDYRPSAAEIACTPTLEKTGRGSPAPTPTAKKKTKPADKDKDASPAAPKTSTSSPTKAAGTGKANAAKTQANPKAKSAVPGKKTVTKEASATKKPQAVKAAPGNGKTRDWDVEVTTPLAPKQEKKIGGLFGLFKSGSKKKDNDNDWKDALGPDGKKNGKAKDSGPNVQAIADLHIQWLKSHGEQGEKAMLKGMDLHGVSLHGLNLKNANFRGADLSDSDCSDVNFEGADLRYVDLSGSAVVNGNLSVCSLRHANLKAANLDGAIMRGVDLAGACLSLGSFKETDLTGSNLLGTDIRETDLSQTIGLQQRQLNKVVGDTSTTLPPGLRIPDKD